MVHKGLIFFNVSSENPGIKMNVCCSALTCVPNSTNHDKCINVILRVICIQTQVNKIGILLCTSHLINPK